MWLDKMALFDYFFHSNIWRYTVIFRIQKLNWVLLIQEKGFLKLSGLVGAGGPIQLIAVLEDSIPQFGEVCFL
jgi:hypothetical protein